MFYRETTRGRETRDQATGRLIPLARIILQKALPRSRPGETPPAQFRSGGGRVPSESGLEPPLVSTTPGEIQNHVDGQTARARWPSKARHRQGHPQSSQRVSKDLMKRAYVTLVNDCRYIEGVKVLSHSLAKTGTEVPLVILTSGLEDYELSQLHGLRAAVWPVDHVEIQTSAVTNFPARSKTFSKINAWLLEDYEKCVFVDADVLVMRNLDYLFEYPEFSAAGSGDYFNTGVFVFEPSRHTFSRLRDAVARISEDNTYSDDSEQEMLQRVFRAEFTPLPYRSNFRPYHNHGVLRNVLHRWRWSRSLLRRLKPEWTFDAIHYIGYPKPWEVYLADWRRDESHYTWTERQLRRVRWSFEMWREMWHETQTASGGGRSGPVSPLPS